MRVLVAFLVSFVLVGTVGALILPAPSPRAKTKPPTAAAPVKPILDFLPGVPSFTVTHGEDTAKEYAEAWRLLKAGRWRTAERAYLQMLMHNPQDQKAMWGLVALQRFLANQNPERLQEQAEAYRRAIAEGRTLGGGYTPREMELLAEASLFAMTEITAEQNLKVSSDSRASISSDLLRPPPPPSTVTQDPVSTIKDRISQVARSLRPAPAKPKVLVGVPVADTHYVVPPSIDRTSSVGLPDDGKPSGGALDEAVNPVTGNPQGTTDPGGDASVGGPSSAAPQSNPNASDSSREGGGSKGSSSTGASSGSTGSGGSGASGNSGSSNGGSGGASAGSGSGGAGAGGGGGGKGGTGKGGKD